MKYELIEVVVRAGATDCGLTCEPDFELLDDLNPGQSAEEIAEALIRAAAEMEIAETRCW